MRLCSADGNDAKDINKSACIWAAGIGSTYARDPCAGNASSIVGACVKDIGPESIDMEGAGMESACTGDSGTVKHSRIHLQSF